MGLIPQAQRQYEAIISSYGETEYGQCASFNLMQILRGSGITTGERIRGTEFTGLRDSEEFESKRRN